MITKDAVRDDPRYRRWVVATTCGELAGFTIPAFVGATATATGAGVAWTIGMLPSTFGGQLLELWPPLLVALGVLAGVALLATIGFAQWLVLRRHVDRSGVRVVANAVAWIAGLAVVSAAIGVAPGNSPVLIAAVGVARGLGMGLAVALVTGLFLVRLLDR